MLTQKELQKKFSGKCGCDKKEKREKMPQTKIDAFMEEFPWVKKLLEGDEVSSVYVTKAEPSIFDYQPAYIGSHYSEDPDQNWSYIENMIFVDKNGKAPTKQIRYQRKKYFFLGPQIWVTHTDYLGQVERYQTVGEVIKALGETADQTRYIFSYHSYTEAVIVYKLPKDVTVSQWIKGEVLLERKKIQKEVEAIG